MYTRLPLNLELSSCLWLLGANITSLGPHVAYFDTSKSMYYAATQADPNNTFLKTYDIMCGAVTVWDTL